MRNTRRTKVCFEREPCAWCWLAGTVPSAYAADGGYIFDDVDVKLFSIGGGPRGSIQKDGSARWFGGGQVRIYPLNGSHSKARRIIGARTLATRESIPIRCKSPHGSICCRGKRLNPFILGGGWYSPVKGPGDSTIRKTDSVDTLGRSPFSAFVLLQWPMQIVLYLVIGLLYVTLPLSAAALTTSDSTKHLYDRVMEEFQHRDYDAALAGFRLFMELHPGRALAIYERERRPIVEKILAAANASSYWYERFPEKMAKFEPWELAYDYMTRSGRMTDERLREVSPEFMSRVSAERNKRHR